MSVDETDVAICSILLANSRTTVRDIADRLKLSIQAVHRRIALMEENGVIVGYRACVSLSIVRPVILYVMGTSSNKDMASTVAGLREDDRTYIALESDRSYLTICALLRDLSHMESYVEMVRRVGGMERPRLGIVSLTQLQEGATALPSQEDVSLTALDYRIILAMENDARRPIEDIASEIGSSPATVRKRLDRMVASGAIDLMLHWNPSASDLVVAQLLVETSPGSDKRGVAAEIMNRQGSRMLAFVVFSNLPDLVLTVVWARTLKDLSGIRQEVASVPGVSSVEVNTVHKEHMFPTWINKDMRAKARPSQK